MCKLSGIVITFNEEQKIVECIRSLLLCCDEVIVVDSGSDDKTVELASDCGAKVFFNEWHGFGKQKNYALSLAKGEWILSLDADERITEELSSQILNAIDSREYELFSFKRITKAFGQWIKYSGWSNDVVVRLFKNGRFQFTDSLVHEKLNILGHDVCLLNSPILHYRNDDLEGAIKRMDQYSSLWASQNCESKSGFVYLSLLKGVWVFFKIWIVKGGFLDGRAGFLIALTNAFGAIMKYSKLYLLKRNR